MELRTGIFLCYLQKKKLNMSYFYCFQLFCSTGYLLSRMAPLHRFHLRVEMQDVNKCVLRYMDETKF